MLASSKTGVKKENIKMLKDLKKISTEYNLEVNNINDELYIKLYNKDFKKTFPTFVIIGDEYDCSLCDENENKLLYIDESIEKSISVIANLLTDDIEEIKKKVKIAIDENDLSQAIGMLGVILNR